MNAKRRAEILALLDAATPGPWESAYSKIWGPPGSGEAFLNTRNDPLLGEYGPIACTDDDEYVGSKRAIEDAALIAAAPTIIAELLAENERLQRALANAAMQMTDAKRAP